MHEYTIYFEKLYEIFMTFELMQKNDYLKFTKSIHIFVDNQTSLQIFYKFKQKSNQYILKKIVELHHEFIVKHKITLHWISVHKEISNNELTNIITKKTINWKKKNDENIVLRFCNVDFSAILQRSRNDIEQFNWQVYY